MQDCYVGDVGDFLKYGLLNFIIEKCPTLRLGVNWYIPEQKAFSYLEATYNYHSSLKACNKELFIQMQKLNKNKLDEISKKKILPEGTIYFDKPLSNKRYEWHEEALQTLKRADIVFLDPDNGIQTTGKTTRKHVLKHEIDDYFKQKQSLIIYNHCNRQPEKAYKDRLKKLTEGLGKSKLKLLRGNRYQRRDFLFIIQPKHEAILSEAIKSFGASGWVKRGHFNEEQI